ncbi:MAG TPA: molybdenum cofactor biosynthesis protein MoaE [Terriglobales bacterium]|nr:molybdenum cofactor biosynthesis protein MoaE [Terriglobales bacterium]
MQVRVLFFGVLKDLVGQAEDSLSLPERAILRDVLSYYEERIPELKALSSSIAMSINQQYAPPESKLEPQDEVALLPPVSGGSQDATLDRTIGRTPWVKITRERIDTPALLEKMKCPADGAVVVFEGIVRDNSRGRRTLFLDYEAYEEMALKQMQSLVEQALSKFPVREALIVHRLGRLAIGEASVVIVVASAHRAAAFDAGRYLIDTLKRTVPIWKKEHFADGAVWADGEPFPQELAEHKGSCPEKPASN